MSIPIEDTPVYTSGEELSCQFLDSFNRLKSLLEIDFQIKTHKEPSQEDYHQYNNACHMIALSTKMGESLAPLLDNMKGVYPPRKEGQKENLNPNSRIDLVSRLTALRLWLAMAQQLVTLESYAWDDVNKDQVLPLQVTIFDMATKATHSTVLDILLKAYPGMKEGIDDRVKNAHQKVVELNKPEQQT